MARPVVTVADIAARIMSGGRSASVHGDGSVVLHGVTHSSANVNAGDLFACIRGRRHDGHDYAVSAVESGAVALLVERICHEAECPQIVVDDVRGVLGDVASAICGDPSQRLTVIGITGTNGKTTTAAMIDTILTATGRTTVVLGTLTGGHTTPEAPVLQKRLADAVADGADTVVMEVSSHALVEGRVNGVAFDVVAFTNLGRDHLDLHGSQEEYFRAKSLLFTDLNAPVGVISVDDRHGRLLADTVADGGSMEIVEVGEELTPVRSAGPDMTTMCVDGVSVAVTPTGHHNAANARVAIAVAQALGVSVTDAARALATMGTVPGRMERVDSASDDIAVVVDYAHTPDALTAVLAAVRHMTSGEVRLVFGCGGERDRDKRPQMGAAARAADVVTVTSDNPRSEAPEQIIDEIMTGLASTDGRNVSIERVVDRAEAIDRAIAAAAPGDVVLIAGRGHEHTQATADGDVDLDDRDEARRALGRRRSGVPA